LYIRNNSNKEITVTIAYAGNGNGPGSRGETLHSQTIPAKTTVELVANNIFSKVGYYYVGYHTIYWADEYYSETDILVIF
jgi:hypothetical protein